MQSLSRFLNTVFLQVILLASIIFLASGKKTENPRKKTKSDAVPPGKQKPAEKQTRPGSTPTKKTALPAPPAVTQNLTECTDQFCETFSVTTSVNPSCQQGCYVDVTVSHVYDYLQGTNTFTLPHGIYIGVCPGNQILSWTILPPSTWFNNANVVFDPAQAFVYWVKGPANPGDDGKILPKMGDPLKVRIRLAHGICQYQSCLITVRELLGFAYPNMPQYYGCERKLSVTGPGTAEYFIGSPTVVCKGKQALTLNVNAPAGSTVSWYMQALTGSQCPPANCPLDTSWILVQSGGSSFNTNLIDTPRCYVAVVTCGCSIGVSNVRRIEVCESPPENTVAAAGSATQSINGIDHVCGTWSGTLSLVPQTFACPLTVVDKWEYRYRTLSYPHPCSPKWGLWHAWQDIGNSAGEASIFFDTGTIMMTKACKWMFEFHAVLHNACGSSTPSWLVVNDAQPNTGTIASEFPLPLCYDTTTILRFKSWCAEVLGWEYKEELSPCTDTWPDDWTSLDGSQGTCIWWTNRLKRSTRFRVIIRNGACPVPSPDPAYSPEFTVTVKPPLTNVHVTANKTILCSPGSVTLTAHTSYDPPCPCPYPLSYQWFLDGQIIPGATNSTCIPQTGGNYSVAVSDGTCRTVVSDIVTIWNRPILVLRMEHCCLCSHPDTVTLTAELHWTPTNGLTPPTCQYQWSPGNATTPSINVHHHGVYTVTVTCGECGQMTAQANVPNCKDLPPGK